MIISSHFAKFINIALSLWHYLKFGIRILDSFKFQKSQTHNPKGMAKDKKVSIRFTREY